MPTARNSVFAGYISGKIYIIGGGIHPYGTFLDIVEAYDIQEDKWVSVDDPLPIARYNGGSATVGSKIFAIGGTEQNAPPETRSARVEVFTPDSNKFLLSSPLKEHTVYTAPVSSVFDHSMKGRPYDRDGIDEIVVAFTGEQGSKNSGSYPGTDCYKNAAGQAFIVNGNYTAQKTQVLYTYATTTIPDWISVSAISPCCQQHLGQSLTPDGIVAMATALQ